MQIGSWVVLAFIVLAAIGGTANKNKKSAAGDITTVSSTTPKPTTTTRPTLKPTSTTRPKLKPTTTTRPKLKPTTTTRPKLKPTTTTRPKLKPTTTTRPKPKPRPTAPPNPDEVTFDCAGNAPGVDISYGDDSSNLQGSLPLHVVAPLNPDAQYYAISAQLGGSGTVTCRVTVHFGGEIATRVGTASGGYNIAQPEVCSTFDGGWQAC